MQPLDIPLGKSLHNFVGQSVVAVMKDRMSFPPSTSLELDCSTCFQRNKLCRMFKGACKQAPDFQKENSEENVLWMTWIYVSSRNQNQGLSRKLRRKLGRRNELSIQNYCWADWELWERHFTLAYEYGWNYLHFYSSCQICRKSCMTIM